MTSDAPDQTAAGAAPLHMATPVVFDRTERWAATYRAAVGLVLTGLSAVLAPQLAAGTLAFTAVAVATLFYVHVRPHTLPRVVKAALLVLDAGLAGAWHLALPDEPLLPMLFTVVVLAWAAVYGLPWGLAAAGICTSCYVAASWWHGDAPGEVLATATPIAIVLATMAMSTAGLLAQLRSEWERVQREKARRRQDSERHLELVGRVAGTVAHEMNNTLTAILGLASLMQHDAQGAPRLEEDLDALTRACRDGQRVVENLLGMAGRGEMTLEHLDTVDVLRSATRQGVALVPSHAHVTLHADHALPPVLADRASVVRALVNLVVNASEASGGAPVDIAIRARGEHVLPGEHDHLAPGDWLRIEVTDDGPGLDPDTQAVAWDPLFSSKTPSGVGLGLAFVQQIVRRHGGWVTLDSTPGQGTTVLLWLPTTHEQSISSHTSTPGPPRDGAVLLVEDERAVASAIRRMLEERGRTVIHAATGHTGVALAQQWAPTVATVLCDIGLPDAEGPAVVRSLRAVLPQAHIVVMSGDHDAAAQLARWGADAFLPKPFGRDALIDLMEVGGPTHASERVHSPP